MAELIPESIRKKLDALLSPKSIVTIKVGNFRNYAVKKVQRQLTEKTVRLMNM